MLHGCCRDGGAAGVIVGQNWGSSSSITIDDEEEDRGSGARASAMVDMIQPHQHPQIGGGLFDLAPPPVSQDCDEDRVAFAPQWRDSHHHHHHHPNPFAQYYSAGKFEQEGSFQDHSPSRIGGANKLQLFQREIEVSSKPDLKILFPSSSSEQQSCKKAKRARDGDDDLLTLRPPNSAQHSEITTSSIDRESSIQQQQQQQQALSRFKQHPAPGLELLTMLLECAQAVHRLDLESATDLLSQLKQGGSVYGDSMQRLAAHFAQGLATRILQLHAGSRSLSGGRMDLIHSLIGSSRSPSPSPTTSSSQDEYLGAFTALYMVSPFFKLAHFTANQAIVEAVENYDVIHILDLDILQGFQWPSLIQALASRAQGPPSLLKITGIGCNAESLRETGNRLSSFAAMFRVPFRFQALAVGGGLEELDLGVGLEPPTPGEAVAVNAIFQLHRLLNAPREALRLERFLAGIKRIRPRAIAIVEQEAAHNAPDFISRFVEALHYYAAVFDSLDASLPQRNEERVRIEQLVFAAQIRNIVSCEGEARTERHEKMGFWAEKMSDCGFVQAPMSSHSISQAKLLLQLCPCDGYRLVESPCEAWPVGSISLGWQQRLLLTASTWSCSS